MGLVSHRVDSQKWQLRECQDEWFGEVQVEVKGVEIVSFVEGGLNSCAIWSS